MKNTVLSSISVVAVAMSSSLGGSQSVNSPYPPRPIGKIEDQTIFVLNEDSGPMSLHFDLTPFFESGSEPLNYCVSNMFIDGNVSDLTIILNPFTGMLDIPIGWFGAHTIINLKIIAKNPYGSAFQSMKVLLESCGG
jgi:hypothetical protein